VHSAAGLRDHIAIVLRLLVRAYLAVDWMAGHQLKHRTGGVCLERQVEHFESRMQKTAMTPEEVSPRHMLAWLNASQCEERYIAMPKRLWQR
jgi:hypothetical protein